MDPTRPFPTLHPLPAWRLAASLGGTLWAVARIGEGASAGPAAGAWASRLLRLLGVEAELAAPIPAGAQVWVSNHLSWLDPLIYLSLRPSTALAKAEVADYPIIGRGARRIGMRFVDRSDLFSRALALRRLVRDLRAGRNVLLFPEGTTTSGRRLAPLYEGGLRMAHRLGVSLLPFRLTSGADHYPWTGDASLLPHLRRLAWSRGTRVRVAPGPLLVPRAFPDEEAWVRAIRCHLDA